MTTRRFRNQTEWLSAARDAGCTITTRKAGAIKRAMRGQNCIGMWSYGSGHLEER